MRQHFRTGVALILFFILGAVDSAACTLKMGYRTSARPPLIAEKPDNSGLYFDLYDAAAKRMDCKLEVIRLPKNRILAMLEGGQIDFYPGFDFTGERSQYIFYIENGLPGGNVGMSRVDMKEEITDLCQLEGKTLLGALGGPDLLEGLACRDKIIESRVPEMTIDQAVLMLRKKRADFYIYERGSLQYHLKKNNITDMKLHLNCCGGEKPLYLGFSRKSPHFKEIPNSRFDPNKPLDPDNFSFKLDDDSLAYKLEQTLAAMKADGTTDEIYRKYYGRLPAQAATSGGS